MRAHQRVKRERQCSFIWGVGLVAFFSNLRAWAELREAPPARLTMRLLSFTQFYSNFTHSPAGAEMQRVALTAYHNPPLIFYSFLFNHFEKSERSFLFLLKTGFSFISGKVPTP